MIGRYVASTLLRSSSSPSLSDNAIVTAPVTSEETIGAPPTGLRYHTHTHTRQIFNPAWQIPPPGARRECMREKNWPREYRRVKKRAIRSDRRVQEVQSDYEKRNLLEHAWRKIPRTDKKRAASRNKDLHVEIFHVYIRSRGAARGEM